MSLFRPPLPPRLQTCFASLEYMEGGLNTKTIVVGEHLIESPEDIYHMPNEEQASAVAIAAEDFTDDYLHPTSNSKAEANKRKERIRRWHLDKTSKQQLLTVDSPCSSRKLESGENTKTGNETKTQESNVTCTAFTISSIFLVLSAVMAYRFWVFLSSTTEGTTTTPNSAITKSGPTCNSILMEEFNILMHRVERQDLRIENLTNQLQKITELVKNLSNKIDQLELYMNQSAVSAGGLGPVGGFMACLFVAGFMLILTSFWSYLSVPSD